jgi:hypothetical protein
MHVNSEVEITRERVYSGDKGVDVFRSLNWSLKKYVVMTGFSRFMISSVAGFLQTWHSSFEFDK